ncbi:MAG: alpha/beta hydrolase [Desulfarculaceae bacterium]|nr:alpha/beta hydrolase [Desulfarculaceae bacterium]MCF8071262.1 alpha/beta hydrolase [Desulfarculaceae bacterium]MCF8101135.1 alpha/beta hydrolase [Desulfarculaceae bacterium]MCF8115316.1 alpha/beta hydrolase [Desulfarculaceae bacterium]
MADFQRYIGIDYSGAAAPDKRLPGLRVYTAEGDGPAEEVRPDPENSAKNWARRRLAEWLLGQLKEDKSALVGIDHAFSFPEEYFARHNLPRNWDAFLTDFHKYWPTDEPEAVAGKLKEEAGKGKERGGETRWRRLTEQQCGAKSVFQFNVNGTVAHSTHAGLPWLLHLRKELGRKIHFWPFDGWEVPAGKSAVIEVYPALFRPDFPLSGVSLDQHDAYAVAKWMQQKDLDDTLKDFLQPNLTRHQRRVAEYEGWILGVMGEATGMSDNLNPLLLPDGQVLGQSGDYLVIDGIKTYYEVHGTGEPLLLLMGGLVTLESLAGILPGLMERYRVWLPERRGHGRSHDGDAPHSYALYAADAAGFMQAVGLGRAPVVGWSDGGGAGLYLALEHPELVERLALIGTAAHVTGYDAGFYNLAKEMTVDTLPAEDRHLLSSLTPLGPEHLPRLVAAVKRMWLTSPVLLDQDLAKIKAPCLVLIGQHDLVRLEHAAAMARALPQGQLAVAPGVSHYGPTERPWLINSLLLDFLEGAPSLGLEPGE